jgi:ubiquinone/menaquinone biosynthesis C-methylase UbiE
MAVTFTAREISAKYDRFARWFDLVEGIPDLLGVRKLRKRILPQASGEVLEVAVGTGKNLHYYPERCRIIGVDISREMLSVGRKRAAKLFINVSLSLADAEALPFPDKTFDTVVSTLTMCTFPDPVNALKEMARVCRPGGRVLLIEHGRSDRAGPGRWQDRHADNFASRLGCHWNREPLELVREAGLHIITARRNFFGVFHEIEAAPGFHEI